jgi:hypothetical protein
MPIHRFWRDHRELERHGDNKEHTPTRSGVNFVIRSLVAPELWPVTLIGRTRTPLKHNYIGTELDRVAKESKRLALLELVEHIEIFGKRTDGRWTNVRLNMHVHASKALGAPCPRRRRHTAGH